MGTSSDCRKTVSLRDSAHTVVAIPPDFQTFSFQNRKFLRSTGGFPHQSADWFGMTTYLSDFFDMLWRYPYGCLFFVPMKLLLAVWGIMCYNKPNYAENGYFLQR